MKTGSANDEYRDGWDRIFGKKLGHDDETEALSPLDTDEDGHHRSDN